MDTLSFLDGKEPEEVIDPAPEPAPAEPEAPAADPVETAPAQPRGPDGKFAPKEEPKPDPVMVPLAALQEVRDEVRALKAERDSRQAPQEPAKVPDMFEDPEGYQAYHQQQLAAALYSERYNSSLRFAEIQHGKEAVQQAVNWAAQRCNADPTFNQQAVAHVDPVGFAIDQYRRDQMAQVDPGEWQKYQAWQAAQAQTQQPAPQGQQPSQPPQSIASLPSSGGATHIPVGPGQAFDNLFTQ